MKGLAAVFAIFCIAFQYVGAFWTSVNVPGTYDGKDSNGNRICITSTNTCFTIWIDAQPPTPPGGPGGGTRTAIAQWVPDENKGLCNITSVSWVHYEWGDLYTTNTNEHTFEESTYAAVATWVATQ